MTSFLSIPVLSGTAGGARAGVAPPGAGTASAEACAAALESCWPLLRRAAPLAPSTTPAAMATAAQPRRGLGETSEITEEPRLCEALPDRLDSTDTARIVDCDGSTGTGPFRVPLVSP